LSPQKLGDVFVSKSKGGKSNAQEKVRFMNQKGANRLLNVPGVQICEQHAKGDGLSEKAGRLRHETRGHGKIAQRE